MSQNATARKTDDRLPELIAERDRYQEWIESLENERAEIPDHIYERIHADYSERLEKAVEALREHLDTLEDRLDERRSELDEVVEALAAKQDELVESQIRHRVGEFDARRWQTVEKTLTSAIKEAEARKEELEAEVARLEETIAQVRQPVAVEAGDTVFLKALAEASGRTGGANGNGARESSNGANGAAEPVPNRPRRPTGLRTLRCDVCGTFNLPEAMFCEACGGDLPAS